MEKVMLALKFSRKTRASSIIFLKTSKIVGLLPESLKGFIPPHPQTGNSHSAFDFYSRNLPLFTGLH